MARRFQLTSRFADDASLNAQLTAHRLQGLGYRRRPHMRHEGDEPEHRAQLFERTAQEHESLQGEMDRIKAAGLWTSVRSLRLL